jgi:hypothetical protein
LKGEGDQAFYRAIRKYGSDNFKFEILKECETEDEAYELEKSIIDTWKLTDRQNGYNILEGGKGGYTLSEETRQKISKTLSGRTLPEEVRHKVSEANMGHEVDQETRDKISKANFGKRRTKEQKQTISDATKKACNTDEHAQALSKALRGYKRKPRTKEHCQNLSAGRRNSPRYAESVKRMKASRNSFELRQRLNEFKKTLTHLLIREQRALLDQWWSDYWKSLQNEEQEQTLGG